MKKEINAQDKVLGALIRDKRKEKNLTGSQVGAFVGVSKSAVSRWESGEVANIQLSRLDKLCKLLDIDPLLFIDKNGSLVNKYLAEVKENVTKSGIDLSSIDENIINQLILEALKRIDK